MYILGAFFLAHFLTSENVYVNNGFVKTKKYRQNSIKEL